MTENKAQPASNNTFTQKAIDAASSLANPSKINLSFIPQAFSLRKNVSWSTFIAFILLFFWISVVGLVLFSGAYGALGAKFITILKGFTHPSATESMGSSFAKEVVFYVCGALVSLFGMGYVWRFHLGMKKKFFATMPSYGLFFRILWPLVLSTIVFTLAFISLSMLINMGVVMSFVHLSGGAASHKATKMAGYAVQLCAFIEAICYWLFQSFVLYLIFKRYKQGKLGEVIEPFFKSFYLSFKPFFKQCLRFLVTVAIFYLIIMLPLLIVKPLFSGFDIGIQKKIMMIVSLIYLFLVPWIMTTYFNLYFLMFNSIENYKSGLKSKISGVEVKAEHFFTEPEAEAKPKSKAKPKKAKAQKPSDKKPVTSNSSPKTVDKKRPESKVHAKIKTGSTSKK